LPPAVRAVRAIGIAIRHMECLIISFDLYAGSVAELWLPSVGLYDIHISTHVGLTDLTTTRY